MNSHLEFRKRSLSNIHECHVDLPEIAYESKLPFVN
jgi:hypothetical protein